MIKLSKDWKKLTEETPEEGAVINGSDKWGNIKPLVKLAGWGESGFCSYRVNSKEIQLKAAKAPVYWAPLAVTLAVPRRGQ